MVVASPPKARIQVVSDTYFGTSVADPYRWMEDWGSEEARGWLDSQAAYARAMLDALPHRRALLTRITELNGALPVLSDFAVAGGRTFYLRRDPGGELARLVVRMTSSASERVLVDPNAMTGDAHASIDWHVPSWDGLWPMACPTEDQRTAPSLCWMSRLGPIGATPLARCGSAG